ncbi:MAG TPA: DUF2334 domain-containing protein, partial [Chloroflexota bacterium]
APSLVSLLRWQCESGSELVMHGIEHRRQGALRGPVHLRLRASLFAPNACEFVSLTTEEATHALQDGRQQFLQAGLTSPATFCAPGWLLSPDLLPILAKAGMHRIVGMFSSYDLDTSRRSILPSLGYMGGGTIHEAAIRVSNRLVRLARPSLTVLQVYLHPQGGVENPEVRRVLDTVRRLVEGGWQPSTYQEVLQQVAHV